jgi:hypothetical protein
MRADVAAAGFKTLVRNALEAHAGDVVACGLLGILELPSKSHLPISSQIYSISKMAPSAISNSPPPSGSSRWEVAISNYLMSSLLLPFLLNNWILY